MFNHQARWDRRLPGDRPQNSERLAVTARFSGGTIFPLFFTCSNARFKVHTLHYAWREKKGSSTLHYFSVSDSRDRYCLCLDSETMSWSLIQQE